MRIFIIAGEPSGDLHGSMFIRALQGLAPAPIEFVGIGGPRMVAQGLRSLYPMDRLSVVGLVEVVTHGWDIFRAYNAVREALKRERPDLVVLIDYPGFNLKILGLASRLGLKTMYYITPQVWAWKKRRVRLLERYCRMAAVILPFEEPFLRAHGVRARFVGHPLLDVVRPTMEANDFLASVGLDPEKDTIGLMPGSRRGEVKRHLAVMLPCVDAIKREDPRFQFLMPMTDRGLLTRQEANEVESRSVKVVTGMTYDAMASCRCLLVASGTVTLEAAILGIPHVVMYRLSPITYALGRLLVDVPYISLTNLIAEKGVVDEFVQRDAMPENLKAAVLGLIGDGKRREAVLEELRKVRAKLGPGGASSRAASLAMELLQLGEPSDGTH